MFLMMASSILALRLWRRLMICWTKTDHTKATGYAIAPESFKLGATELAPTITNLINQSIEKCRFPTALIKIGIISSW